jgi:hypothetical protein
MADVGNNTADFPVLVIGATDGGARDTMTPYPGSGAAGPGRQRQSDRLAPQFTALHSAMRAHRLEVAETMSGQNPELVIVFELSSSVQSFMTAVRWVPGLEFLAEFEDDETDQDDEFTVRGDGPLSGCLYVVANNAAALTQILALWTAWTNNRAAAFTTGLAGWRNVFELLRDVREWGPDDRLRDSHLAEEWEPLIDSGARHVTAEIELWYRDSPAVRANARLALAALLRLSGGEVLDEVDISTIGYHALLVQLPVDQASAILEKSSYLVSDRSVASIRPQMVAGSAIPMFESTIAFDVDPPATTDELPLVVVLDGVPLERHELLTGRVQLLDPDGISSRMPASERLHGTGIASLVLWGDLNSDVVPLTRPIMIRPIFERHTTANGSVIESMTSGRLVVAVMAEILDELFAQPLEASVRVVVLAAGHTALPFGRQISPWARLLDHYAATYGVLFVVSAGNYLDPLVLTDDIPMVTLEDPGALRDAVLKHLVDNAHQRRLLSPAEGMNVLTVGALHSDLAGDVDLGSRRDVLGSNHLPSPVSAVGSGYRRSVKPDVFADGGRVLYRELLDSDRQIILERATSRRDPLGVLVASPGLPGQTDATTSMQGTSVATGLVGHQAAALMEALLGGPDGPVVAPGLAALATRALLVNTATWSGTVDTVAAVRPAADRARTRRHAGTYLGYGALQPERIAVGAKHRITILATGLLAAETAREVLIPLPPSLSGRPEWRRAGVTLSTFTPINPSDRAYRRAKVWFDVVNDSALGLKRVETDWQAARRGSIQHELFDGDRAVVIREGATLRLRVNCAAQAGGLSALVPYAIAVTFEMAPTTQVDVYTEVSDRLRARTTVRATQVRV